MDRLISINSPQNQLRQNHSLLLLIGSISSVAGLLIWSASPFIWSSSKDKINIFWRYLSLITTLGCGVTSVICGHQINRINPLIQAINQAEKNDFLTQLAASQYQQEQQWNQLALSPTSRPPIQTIQVPQPADSSTDSSTDSTSDSNPDSRLTDSTSSTSQNSEVLEVEGYRSLYLAVSNLKQQGVSDTEIIESVLGLGGRRFKEGKAALESLLQLGQQEGW
ncbi:hypothetical protein Cri9333_4745 (plasmid) [Crinalium epipsammum PCC 9333]|uniref:Uncharacterized protein n=1 Tax=Crinalium epipsammum PCC 9333 TaxID=1173022 RepID=K9W5Q8_9CYAN|nr:hypothetical protein [Crinalium epipsammum]AFZ15521.1 hypothetical protein Cri9333_4745 [Crinalium epipsammum PCC 9333]